MHLLTVHLKSTTCRKTTLACTFTGVSYIVASISLRLLGLFLFMYFYSSLLINISSCQKPANPFQLRWMNSMGKLLSPGEMCHIMNRKWVFMLILIIWWFLLCVTRQENKIWVAFSMIKVCHVKCWNNKQIPYIIPTFV